MSFKEKLAAAKALLISKGLRRPSYAPTVVAFLWRFGIEIPPPHFAGFLGTFVFSAGLFGVAWGTIMWLVAWSRHGTSPVAAVGWSVLIGLLVGLAVALYYRYSARKHAIPRWDDFVPTVSPSKAD